MKLFLSFLLLVLAETVFAQAYPARPVKVLVGFTPGGGTDIMARFLTPQLSEILGQPFVVENRPGAATNVATELPAKDLRELIAAAKAKPGSLNYSTAGSGTTQHLAGEMFRTRAGIDVVHVPYKG